MCRRVLDWYHLYINHPGGSILSKQNWEVCYWKGLFVQAELYANPCKIFRQFKNRKTIFGHLPPKNISEVKPWDMVHVDLICPYSSSIIQHHLGGAIVNNNVSLNSMTMINPATGWIETVEIPIYDIDAIKGCNCEYIDKSSARVSQLFNNTWLSRYPRPRKVVFDNRSEFKQYFTPLLNYFNIKHVLKKLMPTS